MADTKQATPDFECNCGKSNVICPIHKQGIYIAPDFDDSMELVDSKELSALRLLASRSGPDRTAQATNYDAMLLDAHAAIGAYIMHAHPQLQTGPISLGFFSAKHVTSKEVMPNEAAARMARTTTSETAGDASAQTRTEAGPDRGQQDAPEMWLEFIVKNMCSLCGQVGIIDTRGIKTPANFACGGLHYCICPNGRALKEQSADKLKWLQLQNPAAKAAREGQAPKGDVWIAVEKE